MRPRRSYLVVFVFLLLFILLFFGQTLFIQKKPLPKTASRENQIFATFQFNETVSLNILKNHLGIWPAPASLTMGSHTQCLSLDLKLQCVGKICNDRLLRAFRRTVDRAFWAGKNHSTYQYFNGCIEIMELSVLSETPLDENMIESYTLKVTKEKIIIMAETEWGAIRGLASWAQLVQWHRPTLSYWLTELPLEINDAPRFKYRGLLLDTARHFLPVSTILRQLDAMEMSKLNVLHWHMVDEEAFPLRLKSWPLLAEKGSWAPEATYNEDDVKRVVVYAMDRGIRVIPEIDSPAHTRSWTKGYPWLSNCTHEHFTLDPSNEKLFELMEGVLTEVGQLFPDNYFHLGGDEVRPECWYNLYRKRPDWSDVNAIHYYYATRILKVIQKMGKTPIFYQETFEAAVRIRQKLPKNTIVGVWYNGEMADVVMRAGLRAIYMHGFYLDMVYGRHLYLQDMWKSMYLNEPFDKVGDVDASLLIGGQANMWGEQVNAGSIDSRIWPQASAVAEKLWSPRHRTRDVDEAYPRLMKFSCFLQRQKIRSASLRPDYCDLGPNRSWDK